MENTALQKTWDEAFVGESAGQIDKYLELPEAEQETAEKPHFVVDDINKADWCVRKINKSHLDELTIDQIADDQIARINAWRKTEKENIGRERSFFEGILLPFAVEHLAVINEGKKVQKKSFKTPNGTIGFKAGSTTFVYEDEKASSTNEKLVEYLKTAAPEYIEVKQLAKWGELKKNIKLNADGTPVLVDTGEIITNMKVVKQPNVLYVKG